MMNDISNRAELEQLLGSFYEKALADSVLKPKFEGLDMKKHIPVITDFWDSIIFGTGTYRGNAFEKHIPLGLEEKHFERWLELFGLTVREKFQGERAEYIIFRAETIAAIFRSKLI